MNIRLNVDRPVCLGCGVCVDSCPTDVLRQDEDGKARVAYLEDCQACFLCVFDCPVDAIALVQDKVR